MVHHKSFGCRICKGMMRNKCIFCGFAPPKKSDNEEIWYLYQNWKNFLEYLKNTRLKLIKFNMATTGHPDLDNKIKQHYGDWMTESERIRRIEMDGRADKKKELEAANT